MKMKRCLVGGVLVLAALGLAEVGTRGANTVPAANAVYEKVVGQYMEGKWNELETSLPAALRDSSLTAGQYKDLNAIKLAVIEGRPAWWKQAKADKPFTFRPVLWGRTSTMTFDPAAKSPISITSGPTGTSVTVTWDVPLLESEAQAEHGFTKGELTALGVWMNLGQADGFATLPPDTLNSAMREDAKVLLSRYLDFRSRVTGIYYGPPRSRRWGLWLGLYGYMDKNAQVPIVMSMKAVGGMLVAEVLGHPDKYPSIKLPAGLEDPTEEKVALAIKDRIEKNAWTLAEDMAIREIVKKFATANEKNAYAAKGVVLPNGLAVAFDPDVDAKAGKPKRDAWVKGAYEKAMKGTAKAGTP